MMHILTVLVKDGELYNLMQINFLDSDHKTQFVAFYLHFDGFGVDVKKHSFPDYKIEQFSLWFTATNIRKKKYYY